MCYYVCLPKTESKPNIWSWLEGDIHSPQWLWGTKSAAATVTRRVDFIPASAKDKYRVNFIVGTLDAFNKKWSYLGQEIEKHYSHFYIPKKKLDEYGRVKWREICAPDDELSEALKDLKEIFEAAGVSLHHTNAYAYVRHRTASDAVSKHQYNHSRWWITTDFQNFFGNTTKEFLMSMMAQIFPFSAVIERDFGKECLSRTLDLCFLNGGLPQGTPISPMLTNIMMIPFDYIMTKKCREKDYIYTRYSDDIQVSHRRKFNPDEVLGFIHETLTQIHAPFTIEKEKTKFKSGNQFVLGVMYNQNCDITVGHKNKKEFKATLFNYMCDRLSGKVWELPQLQQMMGKYAYYSMIEKEYFENVMKEYSRKFKQDVMKCIKADLRRC